ncbi:hypothetical protein GGI25_004473 [Coemansia spiralis]|uniref:Uncharacterized protein n=2 Tax=Coemansia TaxID=4863 RepID=A0A9W8KX09_9FUNG|nr:hypothetical protein EDC05_005251 [Coemansia umbellata]KAJ2619843.1 hypothetical protein GGI26_005517 [Coemansia sp. RSA 1358]KAJ2673988.1 hypothetical protein GGI25_004473 [Coemansia spiralis]
MNSPVILRIMRYAAKSSNPKQQQTNGYQPLLAVCRSWRLVLLKYLCSEYTVRFSLSDGSLIGSYGLWPTNIEHNPGSSGFGYITKLNIEVDYNSIFNGTAVHAMLYNLNDSFSFPAAHTMYINIEHCEEDFNVESYDYESQAHVLARHLRRIAPAVKNMFVKYCAYNNIKHLPTGDSFANLLSGLYRNKVRSYLEIQRNDFYTPVNPYIAHSLTDIVCIWNISTCQHSLCLIQNSANTLRRLKLTCVGHYRGTIVQLFWNSHGQLVTYPKVEYLSFGATFECEYNSMRSNLPHHRPFPKLKCLYLESTYPFGDDILFRGNEGTLEYLCIRPDLETLEVLDSLGVFASGRYKSLRYIKVLEQPMECGKSMQLDHMWAAMVSQFVHRASSALQTITIHNKQAGEKLVCALVHSFHMTNLQILDLPCSLFSLADLIALVKAIPALTELHCMSAGVGNDYSGIPHSQLADYMRKNYYPLNRSFKRWHICHDYTKPLMFAGQAESMVACALLMSVVCPRFTSVLCDYTDKDRFNSIIQLALSRNPHGKYNSHLVRLMH